MAMRPGFIRPSHVPAARQGYAVSAYDRHIDGSNLLAEHVERFNAGIRTGDWRPMLELFADDAELRFEGVPVGPFRGREKIRAAYESQPPDDEVDIRNVRSESDRTVADYGWKADDGVRAGELRVTWHGDLIRELVITFE
jgi:hypothetical protein